MTILNKIKYICCFSYYRAGGSTAERSNEALSKWEKKRHANIRMKHQMFLFISKMITSTASHKNARLRQITKLKKKEEETTAFRMSRRYFSSLRSDFFYSHANIRMSIKNARFNISRI
jgi:hypothetical protein